MRLLFIWPAVPVLLLMPPLLTLTYSPVIIEKLTSDNNNSNSSDGGMVEVDVGYGVVPSRMVSVSASVNLPLHHKVQKFSSGTGSPGWSRKRAIKRLCGVVVTVVMRIAYAFLCRRKAFFSLRYYFGKYNFCKVLSHVMFHITTTSGRLLLANLLCWLVTCTLWLVVIASEVIKLCLYGWCRG